MRRPPVLPWLEVKLCNCAQCGEVLLGESMFDLQAMGSLPHEADNLQPVAARLSGRPYCNRCLNTVPKQSGGKTWREDSPSQQNALRHLEDG